MSTAPCLPCRPAILSPTDQLCASSLTVTPSRAFDDGPGVSLVAAGGSSLLLLPSKRFRITIPPWPLGSAPREISRRSSSRRESSGCDLFRPGPSCRRASPAGFSCVRSVPFLQQARSRARTRRNRFRAELLAAQHGTMTPLFLIFLVGECGSSSWRFLSSIMSSSSCLDGCFAGGPSFFDAPCGRRFCHADDDRPSIGRCGQMRLGGPAKRSPALLAEDGAEQLLLPAVSCVLAPFGRHHCQTRMSPGFNCSRQFRMNPPRSSQVLFQETLPRTFGMSRVNSFPAPEGLVSRDLESRNIPRM